LYMFFISSVKCSTCLFIFQWAVQAFRLVNGTIFIFICLWVGFYYVLC
jgi:hypothetical protein